MKRLSLRVSTKLTKMSLELSALPVSRQKHFSYIMDGAKIVSFGYNNGWKTHPLSRVYGHRYHATHSEMHAINNFPYPISEIGEYDMVNIRLRPDGSLGLAAPCRHCRKLLQTFSPRRIWYSNNLQGFTLDG